jgi:cupin 2 domain-containing protein
MNASNIFKIEKAKSGNQEIFETLIASEEVLIERIISTGQVTPDDEYYDQNYDEWVILLQGIATLSFEKNKKTNLKAGDYLFIPAHQKHRVDYTSSMPACIWLAVHIKK